MRQRGYAKRSSRSRYARSRNPTFHATQCALQPSEDVTFGDAFEACDTCNKRAMVNAMPDSVRQLLLRIVRPEKLENGQLDVVTAEEALDVMESVMET